MADEEGFQGMGRLLNRLHQLKSDTQHVERPLKAAGAYMLGSIEKNFKEQGRPEKWQGLAASTLQRRRKGRGKGSPRILIDTARLKNSMQFRVWATGIGGRGAVGGTGLEIGTNVVYARRQHFGYEGGEGPGHAPTPARPFLMFQSEDFDQIGSIFRRQIER